MRSFRNCPTYLSVSRAVANRNRNWVNKQIRNKLFLVLFCFVLELFIFIVAECYAILMERLTHAHTLTSLWHWNKLVCRAFTVDRLYTFHIWYSVSFIIWIYVLWKCQAVSGGRRRRRRMLCVKKLFPFSLIYPQFSNRRESTDRTKTFKFQAMELLEWQPKQKQINSSRIQDTHA